VNVTRSISVGLLLAAVLALCALPAAAQDAPKRKAAENAGEAKKADPPRVDPTPLTGEQLDRIRTLVQRTQARDAELKSALAIKQRELALAYASFELDEARVSALQEEIVVLQRQLLANYHTLHVELRKSVGPERFVTLIQRINSVLKPAPAPGTAPSGAAPSNTAPGERPTVDRPKARASETPEK
jgi:Spy/CpxP family protein refolding chaperone